MITINVDHVRPPIPTKSWDWCAWAEGEEELQAYGWGATPWEALRALAQGMEDCWPSADKIVE
jgi:hypothetical protein